MGGNNLYSHLQNLVGDKDLELRKDLADPHKLRKSSDNQNLICLHRYHKRKQKQDHHHTKAYIFL